MEKNCQKTIVRRGMTMHLPSRKTVLLLAVGGAVAIAAPALAQDVRARVHVGPSGHPHAAVHVDRFHRVPPDIRLHGLRPHVAVRVNPFHARLGWRVDRFTPRERALWTHGRWWHGRHHGRSGWWWWVDGGWYFYDAPVYPYPGYVSETYYDEPSEDSGDYWYYCRDPEGYYPYVHTCHSSWEPVPAQPGGYDTGGDQYDDQGGSDEDMGPDSGPPDDYGPPDDNGPPDENGPSDDDGPPDEGPPPR
jgi:hypothetical protein